MTDEPEGTLVSRRLRVRGIVQGVGFRPFVHRLATELGLSGSVRNERDAVVIDVRGPAAALDVLARRLELQAPPLAQIAGIESTERPPDGAAAPNPAGFSITTSPDTDRGGPALLPPPDHAPCAACLVELRDPGDRRHRHPFISCTGCGPRHTIVTGLPYDRQRTTMVDHVMCAACTGEYENPADRRFHAQPIACHDCGPGLWWHPAGDAGQLGGRGRASSDRALAAALAAIRSGAIVAVKGVGGYQLTCDATDDDAVRRLRQRKQRPDKPFAVMAPTLAEVRRHAVLDAAAEAALRSPARPIVLLRSRPDSPLSHLLAPGSGLIGVMLPPSPLHHLLLADLAGGRDVGTPVIVCTSGNVSGEPLCIDDVDARARLGDVADGFLLHDRRIAARCDDAVVRIIDGEPVVLRRARGQVPSALPLPPVDGPRVLALGGELKSAICITEGGTAWLSAHIGDLGSLASRRAFEQAIHDATNLHPGPIDILACDLHPDHVAHRWARAHAAERLVEPIQHHHAHIAATMAEHQLAGPVLGIALDGTGLARDEDGRPEIWGGEILLVDARRARRLAHLQPILLPGGDAAIRHPRRVALAHLFAAGLGWDDDLAPVAATEPAELRLLRTQLERGLNSLPTSSAGRLFDAVASLLGLRHDITYEAQAALELEARAAAAERSGADGPGLRLPLRVAADGAPRQLDVGMLVTDVVGALRAGHDVDAIALAFHRSLADALSAACLAASQRHGIAEVCLSGGVFANEILTRLLLERLRASGLRPYCHRLVPPNDGGLALGQALVATARHVAANGPRR